MANILFLTHVLPYPLDAGPKTRAYYVLRHLSGEHRVTLVSFTRPNDPPESLEHLREICHAVYSVPVKRGLVRNLVAGMEALLTGMPMMIVRDDNATMFRTLAGLVRETKFDVVHADQLAMAGYALQAARDAAGPRPRMLLDEHNAFSVLLERMAAVERGVARRMLMKREARAFRGYEVEMCLAFDAVLTVTQEDRRHLLSMVDDGVREAFESRLTVMPICVDPGTVVPAVHRDSGQPTILHLGTMFWPPNAEGVAWFARDVLPLVHRQLPDARFVVVGKNPPPEVEALDADPCVMVTGYVQELEPYLAAADVFVVPVHAGTGMRVKILDAWLWGLPVVSTTIGAEGIEIVPGENILIGDDTNSFADAVVSLLTDRQLNCRLRSEGRAWVETNYAWSAVYRRLGSVYDRLLEKQKS
ncbi:MAG: glycosyltransferase [Anaerolineae bacterium]|nr:glycosyltransferase [Anaerolineae bacterium]